MRKLNVTLAIASLLIALTPAAAQVQARDRQPIYRITINVVDRTTTAINYVHRNGSTTIDFRGTPLMTAARGEAKVESKQGYMEVEVEFDDMQPATRFGPEFLTYVLWAITPEGRATNMGEVILNGTKSKLDVTTELQAFGMVVTAEPYFAVSQPSDVVVLENFVRKDTKGKVEAIDAKYELLQRGQYTVNVLPADLKPMLLDKNTPLDLYEARNAVRIAKWAGADRSAADSFDKASRLLAQAEAYKTSKAGTKSIAMTAREAVQTAEDARLITLKNQAEERLYQERLASLNRETAANAAASNARADANDADRARVAAEAQASLEKMNASLAAQRADNEARAVAERTRAEASAVAERTRSEAALTAERALRDREAGEAANQQAIRTARADANDAERARAAAEAQAILAKANAALAAQRADDEARAVAERTRAEADAVAERTRSEAAVTAERALRDREAGEAANQQAIRTARAEAAEAERVRAAAEALANLAKTNANLAAQRADDEAKAVAERTRAEAALTAERTRRDRETAEAASQRAIKAAAEQVEREKELRIKLAAELNSVFQTKDSARGLIANMSDVLFDSGQYSIKSGAREKLSKISGILLAYPSLILDVGGYTDSNGSDELNQRLSEKRAGAVRDFLVSQGIAGASITAHGFGESAPIATNDTASGRQQNRRVELVVSGEIIGTTTSGGTPEARLRQ